MFAQKTLHAVLAALALAATATACGSGEETYASIVDKAKDSGKLVIGVKADQPGLGLRTPDGTFTGFDIEVARYVAKELGVEPGDIEFKETVSANREAFLQQGQVDMVLATYSITEPRKQKVSFAGPYLVAGQDLLVRADDTELTGPEALNGKKLCSVAGSTPAQKVKENYAQQAQLQEERTYSACVDRVLGGQLDAITTDNVILAGYAAQHAGKLKVVGKPFSTEKYGIGLKKDDQQGREAVNNALEKMFADGSWRKALEDSVGASGFAVPTIPTLERY